MWSAVCSLAPHSHFAKGARPHLCMDEPKRPTPVRRRLSWTARQMLSLSQVREHACPQTLATDQNQIYPNGRASTVTDVLARPCKWPTPFSGRGNALQRIVNEFRRPAILHLNIEGLTASKMSVLYHLAA